MFKKILKGLGNIVTKVNNFTSNQNTQPTKTIEDYKNDYNAAASRYDADAMQRANEGANAIRRSQGVKEQWATKHINSVRKQQQNNVTQPTSVSKSNNNGLLGAINRVIDKTNNITSGGGKGVNIGGKTFYNVPDGMPDIDAETLDLLNGWYSGRTIKGSGYDAYYDNNYQKIQDRYEYYNKTGQEFLANQMLDAINRYNDGKHTSYLATNTFGDWDTGLLDLYIGNKSKWENATPKERQKYETTNAILRQLYGLEEDNLTYNDLGELRSDLLFGDFIDYGLNKEDRNSIPDIISSSMEVDPKFKTARMMARSHGLFGYKPLGQIKSINGQPFEPDYSGEEAIFNAVKGGYTLTPNQLNQNNNVDSNTSDIINKINNSFGSNKVNSINNTIPINVGDFNGGIYETNSGRFVESGGQIKEISDDEFIRFMEQYYGF